MLHSSCGVRLQELDSSCCKSAFDQSWCLLSESLEFSFVHLAFPEASIKLCRSKTGFQGHVPHLLWMRQVKSSMGLDGPLCFPQHVLCGGTSVLNLQALSQECIHYQYPVTICVW